MGRRNWWLAAGRLVDKALPHFAALVPQNDAVTVGNSRDGASVGIPEGVTNRVVRGLFGRPAPDVTVFIAQADVIPIPIAMQPGFRRFFLEVEETARQLAMHAFALIDHVSIMSTFVPRRDEVFP